MKKILLPLTAVALLTLGSAPARAQQYGVTYLGLTNGSAVLLTGSTTNTVAADSTNTINSPITLTKYDTVVLDLGFALDGAGTGNTTFRFAYSADGVNYETVPSLSYSIAANGTTKVRELKQITGITAGYLRLNHIANTNAALIVTNICVGWSVKPKRQG